MHAKTAIQATLKGGSAVAVFGSGVLAEAVAALISIRGHQVCLAGSQEAKARRCDILTDTNIHYTTNYHMQVLNDSAAIKGMEAVVVAVPATAYGATFEELRQHLSSGQTIFVMGATVGAALQVESILSKRSDLCVSVAEVSQPFASAYLTGVGLKISGAKESLMLAGRSLNETRTALSAGGGIFNGMVPASNIFERAFFDMDRWLDAAALLFVILGAPCQGTVVNVLAALRAELQQLAKAYGINRVPEPPLSRQVLASSDAVSTLCERIKDEFVILSSLARLKHVAVPVLDAVIDLASAVSTSDLRKDGRKIEDLGLIGMDAKEIIEHISA